MELDLLTKGDLENFKTELLETITSLIQQKNANSKWLKSSEVKKLLGISSGTLQSYRIKGLIEYSKIGKTFFYDQKGINRILENNKVSERQ